MLKLFAYIIGLGQPFPVKIDESLTFGDLKEEIWKKRSKDLAKLDAASLLLYHVDIPSGPDLEHRALEAIGSKDELDPARKLSKIFLKQPAEETINIVAKRDEGEQSQRSSDSNY
jgi:hypothetical protein